MTQGRMRSVACGTSIWWRWEVPTWTLCAVVYGGWTVLTLRGDILPWWLLVPLGGWFTAWHYSFLHEVIHGHPTPFRPLNDLLGRVPLGLVMPYGIYRETHIRHHRKDSLALPGVDPESFFRRGRVGGQAGGRAPLTYCQQHFGGAARPRSLDYGLEALA